MPISQCACLIYTVTQMGRFTALVEAAGAKYTFEVMAEYTQVGAGGGVPVGRLVPVGCARQAATV